MDTDSFIVYIKAHIFKDIAENIETRFDTSNYELERLLPKENNSYLIDDESEDENSKRHKKVCHETRTQI